MYLIVRVKGKTINLDMEYAGTEKLTIGTHQYHPARLARRVRKLATRMWRRDLPPAMLTERLYFEALDDGQMGGSWVDSGIFTPNSGSVITLGKWDENGTVGIALHELAHDMHYSSGGYDDSDGIVREAVALLAERESGLVRHFEREPYYTASNLVEQLYSIWSFKKQPFQRRWAEVTAITTSSSLADLINYYLDIDEGLGLGRWLQRYNSHVEAREALLHALSVCSLRYSLDYRRTLLRSLVRCNPATSLEQFLQVIDSIATLDQRYPDDDLNKIIDFCFVSLSRPQRGVVAFGA